MIATVALLMAAVIHASSAGAAPVYGTSQLLRGAHSEVPLTATSADKVPSPLPINVTQRGATAGVSYIPAPDGIGAYNEDSVSRWLYGQQQRNYMNRDFRQITKSLGKNAVVRASLGTQSGLSTHIHFHVTSDLCDVTRYHGTRLALALGMRQIVESVGSVGALIGDENTMQRSMSLVSSCAAACAHTRQMNPSSRTPLAGTLRISLYFSAMLCIVLFLP